MKRIYSISILFFVFVFIFSCNENSETPVPVDEIPNGDFENWESLNNMDKPTSWSTSNLNLFSVVIFNTVTKSSSDKFLGEYSARLETKSQIIDNSPLKVVGLLTLGNFNVNIATKKASVSGGIPFITHPLMLEGNYKYLAVGNDSCFITLALTKFNSINKTQDTIADAKFSSASVSDWTSFSIPIHYHSELKSDSLNIIILSSDTSIFNAGSTMWIDNLKLKY